MKFLPDYFIQGESLIETAKNFDFCVSVLHCALEKETRIVFNSVLTECGWIYPFEKTCLIGEGPTEVYFDPIKLHSEIAVKFGDGYNF